MLRRYNSFQEDIILESIVNESIVYFSKTLRELLIRLKDSEIGKSLSEIEGVDVKSDVTFLDIDKDGYLSFSTMRNAVSLIKSVYPHVVDDNHSSINLNPHTDLVDQIHLLGKTELFVKSRNQIKIGKLINKLFPGKFSDKEIEEYVNKFKALLDKVGEKLSIVDGEDIALWYNKKNYKNSDGTLGSSCMRGSEGIFGIYTNNPEVCRLLILTEDSKLIGRSIIWRLNSINKEFGGEKPEYFMDRQYTAKDSDVNKFINYAKEQGWAYKTNNNHHSVQGVTFKDQSIVTLMSVQLKPVSDNEYEYKTYPYVDTFRRYNPSTGELVNDEDDDSDNEGCYLLDSTSGGYTKIEGGVFSEYYDCRIPESEAVYSDRLNDYLWRDRSVFVERGSNRTKGCYPDDYEDIVYNEWDEEYLHVDDSQYSERYGYYIYQDDAVEVIISVNRDGNVRSYEYMHDQDDDIMSNSEYSDTTWFEKLVVRDDNWSDRSCILKELMFYSDDNIWIPKVLKIFKFKVTETLEDGNIPIDLNGIEYLREMDAYILGYNFNKSDSRTTDPFKYQEDVESISSELKERLEFKTKQLLDIITNTGKQKRIQFDFDDDKEYLEKIKKKLSVFSDRLEDLENDRWK